MKHLNLFPNINVGDFLKLQRDYAFKVYPSIIPSKNFDSYLEYEQAIHSFAAVFDHIYKKLKKDEVIFIAELKQETYYVKGKDYYYPFLFVRVIDSGGENTWIQMEQHKHFPYLFSICK
jgi:hypothetical protein